MQLKLQIKTIIK